MSRRKEGTLSQKVQEYKNRRESKADKNLTDDEMNLIELLMGLDRKYEKPLIIVEGRQDERALRHFGIKSRIMRTQTGLSRAELVDQIASIAGRREQVLILTDFDREGSDVCGFLQKELELHKVKVLKGLRRRIRTLMGDRRCVEDLGALFHKKDSLEMAT